VRSNLRRSLAVLAPVSLLLGLLAVGLTATPAAADQLPRILLPVDGSTLTFHGPQLIGANYTQGRGPTACAAATRKSCVTIPIQFLLDDATVQAHELIFTVTTRWDVNASQTVPAVGTGSDDQINTYIYTDPPKLGKGSATSTCGDTCELEETSAFLSPPPTTLTIYRPQSNKFLITVENMYGVDTNGFTLDLSVNDLSGGPGADLSADTAGPVDYSDDTASLTPSYDGSATPSSSGSAVSSSDLAPAANLDSLQGAGLGSGRTPVTFDTLGLRPDADLDTLSGVDTKALVDLGAARQIATVAVAGPPKARPASGLALVITLVVLPSLAAFGLLIVGWRRRNLIGVE